MTAGQGAIPLKDYFDRWCNEHEDRQRQSFADMAQALQNSEQRMMTTLTARFEEHGRQHAMEQAANAEFKSDVKVSLDRLSTELVGMKVTIGKASGIVGAAIVVAGMVIKFL